MTNSERGFTFVGLLLAVALLGVALASVGQIWSTTLQRERELELLFVGDEFRRAIESYHEATPGGGMKEFPKTLEVLLLDRRYPVVRRHLRKIYADPLTGRREWGIVSGPGDTVMGVYSLSQKLPRKQGNFPPGYESFEGKSAHADWRFVYGVTMTMASGSKSGKAAKGRSNASSLAPLSPVLIKPATEAQSQVLQSTVTLSNSSGSATPANTGYQQRTDLPSSAATGPAVSGR